MNLEKRLSCTQTQEYNTAQAQYIQRLYCKAKEYQPNLTMTQYILDVYLNPAYQHEKYFKMYWEIIKGGNDDKDSKSDAV